MRLIVTDADVSFERREDDIVISDNGRMHHCIGCFGCWIKTPGQCVIKDGYENLGVLFSRCSELIIISRCVYGGFSPFAKNVWDRALAYVSPHFAVRSGELHHKRRYTNKIALSALFYGENIPDSQKETARNIVAANAVNYDCTVVRIEFFASAQKAGEAL